MSWKQTTLGEIVNLKRGFDLPASKRIEGPYPIYSSSGQTGTHSEAAVNGPCVITGRYGTIGQVFFSDKSCWPLNTSLYSTDFKGNNPRFVYYLLKTVPWQEYTTASAVPGVNRNHVHRCPVCVPDYRTQTAIVSVLGALDEQMAINVKLNGYLAALLDAKFEKLLDNVGGWGEASLLDIANYKNGLAMQKFRPKAGDPGLPVLKIRELGQGCCGPDSERCQSDIDKAVAVHDGDLVFSWSGTLLLDFWAGGDAGLNQHLFKVTSAAYPSWFYYMWTKYHLRKFIAMAKDRATTMGHIKRSALADSKVLIPERPILEELTESMQPIVDQVILNKVENRKLGSLRDVLLPKLMSGEIDVSKVDLTQLNSHFGDCSLESSFQKPKER